MRCTVERSFKTDEPRELISLTVLGKDRKFLSELLDEALRHWEAASPANVFIFLPAPPPDDWLLQSKKVGRSMDSVVLPQDAKEHLMADSTAPSPKARCTLAVHWVVWTHHVSFGGPKSSSLSILKHGTTNTGSLIAEAIFSTALLERVERSRRVNAAGLREEC